MALARRSGRRWWKAAWWMFAGVVLAGFMAAHHIANDPVLVPMLPRDAARSQVAVVYISGDSGIHLGMTSQVGERFVKAGVPVIAVDSHAYFTTRRTPAETAALIGRAIDEAIAVSAAKTVLVVGHSYGADMLHVGLSLLPPSERAKIKAVALIVPGRTVFFQISWGERYDLTEPDADALPTAQTLTWTPALCIRGAEETSSLCPALEQPNVKQLVLPGGHYLHRDADAVYRALSGFLAAQG